MKDKLEVFWISEQPYGHVTDEDLAKYESGRLGFPKAYTATKGTWPTPT
jgi:hypothetical protein